MQRDLPSGTVTFLFSDIEGSTALLHELGTEAYTDALMGHRSALRSVFSDHGGVEVGTEGDSFFIAFPDAAEAYAAEFGAGLQVIQVGGYRIPFNIEHMFVS